MHVAPTTITWFSVIEIKAPGAQLQTRISGFVCTDTVQRTVAKTRLARVSVKFQLDCL